MFKDVERCIDGTLEFRAQSRALSHTTPPPRRLPRLRDVHLVTLIPALEGLIVPSKFYGIAAAGRPAIFVGDAEGEIGRVLREHRCGIVVRPGDAEALVAAILELKASPERRREMGARARAAFEANWDKPIALAKWGRVIEEVAGH